MAPAAPKNARWTRISNQDVTIQWDAVPGATSYGIQYQKGGAQNEWTRPGWTSRTNSFTARGFSKNLGFRFRIYATDKSGNSQYSNVTGWFYTPPPKPTVVKAAPNDEGVLLTVGQSGVYYPSGLEWESPNGLDVDRGSVLLGSGTGGKAPTSYLALGDGGDGLKYRVRRFVGAEGSQTRVFSPWSDYTKPLSRWSAPLAPEISSDPFFMDGGPVTLRYLPMPTDQSQNNQVEVRLRPQGTTDWLVQEWFRVEDLAHELEVVIPNLSGVGTWEWQAKTDNGVHMWGPWSATAIFALISRPVVSVVVPDKTRSKLTAQWTFTQAQGLPQSSVVVSLLQGGGIIEQRRGTGPATSTTFNAVLTNQTAYQLRVEAACSGVQAAAKTVSWTTAFVPPTAPTISAVWDDAGGFHQVTVAPGEGGSKPTVSLDVHRDTGDGWGLVAEGLSAGEHVLADYLGLTYGDTVYRVTAWTSEGASATAETVVQTRSEKLWVRWEQVAVGLAYNASSSYTPEKHDSSLIYFDGEVKPTLIEGEGVSRKATVSGTLVAEWHGEVGDLSAERARDLLEAWVVGPGILPTLSTPDRLTITGTLGAQFSMEMGGLTKVQLSVEEAR